jgi:RNA polymerase sigma factor (TIGR02999 family)
MSTSLTHSRSSSQGDHTSAEVEQERDAQPCTTHDLIDELYSELRQLARYRLAGGRPDNLLQTTGLVHEVYLRLTGNGKLSQWENRSHFFSAASEAMRRVLVDHARAAKRQRRGAGVPIQPLIAESGIVDRSPDSDWLWDELDEGLTVLESEEPVTAELVKLRVFSGLPVAEAGSMLGLSRTVAYEHWSFARSWFQVWHSNHSGKPQ